MALQEMAQVSVVSSSRRLLSCHEEKRQVADPKERGKSGRDEPGVRRYEVAGIPWKLAARPTRRVCLRKSQPESEE